MILARTLLGISIATTAVFSADPVSPVTPAVPTTVPSLPAPAPEFIPGCVAKIYPSTEWPITELPEAPGEVLRLPDLPTIDASGDKKKGGNFLVESQSGILEDAEFYTVVFDGFIFAKEAGQYGLTIQCDDPVTVTVEGQELKRITSDFIVKLPGEAPVDYLPKWKDFALEKKFVTKTDAVLLGAGRYYRIQITCKQRRAPAPKLVHHPKSPNASGAVVPEELYPMGGGRFRALLVTPSSESGPLKLWLPKS